MGGASALDSRGDKLEARKPLLPAAVDGETAEDATADDEAEGDADCEEFVDDRTPFDRALVTALEDDIGDGVEDTTDARDFGAESDDDAMDACAEVVNEDAPTEDAIGDSSRTADDADGADDVDVAADAAPAAEVVLEAREP